MMRCGRKGGGREEPLHIISLKGGAQEEEEEEEEDQQQALIMAFLPSLPQKTSWVVATPPLYRPLTHPRQDPPLPSPPPPPGYKQLLLLPYTPPTPPPRPTVLLGCYQFIE
ncbi:hypothetical protein Pcinc_013539 [Petrolisthes cinctipes]|uniref:Uncharacterized protein n=1 Tax=Petrolisthes cinctipes TaxID=88211 RepID=A0AAE1FYF7_PETCI|nr:hypothetical protein Pcinc_013539 [Petrolisthes cinctipes]